MPNATGTYTYVRELYGPNSWGRLASFAFTWQFLISGPLETSSGLVAAAQYMVYITKTDSETITQLLGCAFGVLVTLVLYQSTRTVGWVTLVFGSLTLLVIGFTIAVVRVDLSEPVRPTNARGRLMPAVWRQGMANFEARNFRLPPNWANPDDTMDGSESALSSAMQRGTMLSGLLGAARMGIYDFTGYFDVNFIGSKVKALTGMPVPCKGSLLHRYHMLNPRALQVVNPMRTIPVACISTCYVVCGIYFLVYVSVMAYLPWDGPEGFVARASSLPLVAARNFILSSRAFDLDFS